MQRIIWIKCGK